MNNNWKPIKLGEVCKKITDGSHNPPKGIEYSDYLMLSSKNIFDDCINLDSPRYLSEADFNIENKRTDVQIGDVLLTIVGTIGRVAVVSSDFSKFTLQRSVAVLKNKQEFIDSRFLMRSLQNIFDELTQKARGVAQKGLYLNQIKELEIPLPPIAEQQRIVAILDEAFAAIAQAKENAEKNLQNARELFNSYLQSVFANPGDGWEEREFEDCLERIIYTNKIQRKSFLESGEYPIVSQEQDFINGYWNNADDLFKVKKPVVIFGDHTQVLKYVNFDFVLGADGVKILQPINDLNPKYFFYFLKNTKFKTLGYARHYRLLKELSVMIPSISEQETIVSKLELLSAETKKLENIYRQKINDLDELKKSILQKAFSGELTAKSQVSNVIDIKSRKPISTTDLQAGIVALAFQQHQQKGNVQTFGHVKAEKIVHLAQAVLEIELEREPVKDAAGPNDYSRLLKVESRAAKAGFFRTEKKDFGYSYTKGSQFESLIEKTKTALSDKADELIKLIDLFVPMNTQQAELVATVYASWNNLLIDNLTITDESIVTEARENWHEAKLKIERDRFFKTINWMKENNLIPNGKGKKVSAKK